MEGNENKNVEAKEQKEAPAADSAVKEEKAGQETKTYDQAYIEKLLAEQRAAQEAAVAEALKVAKMGEEDKEQYEKQKADKELAERETAIARRELKADAKEVLAKNDVPGDFLDMLMGESIKETESRVAAFKKSFDTAVQAQVESRLAGKTPKAGNGGGKSEAEQIAAEIDRYMD